MHVPAFNKEIIEHLEVKPTGCYVDLTLGGGGHSRGIVDRLAGGTLVAFDLDAEAVKIFADCLDPESMNTVGQITHLTCSQNQVYLVVENYGNMQQVLESLNLNQVDGIIADLGWSTEQLNRLPGLSFSQPDEKLDMRFDKRTDVTAADLLNALYANELQQIFTQNADLKYREAKQLAEKIVGFRQKQSFVNVGDLLQAIDSAFAPAINQRKLDGRKRFSGGNTVRNMPARVFQALRIAVNSELSKLQSMLSMSWSTLEPGGTLQVITFHSAEDRIVSQKFSSLITEASAQNLYSQEFLLPSVAELSQNLRARSAKLRGIRKISGS